jgi:hypothetical protein
MLALCSNQPLLPRRPIKEIAEDLMWWSEHLQAGHVSRPIYPPTRFSNPQAFSDASSGIGIGIGIVIGKFWRAWRLVPGWQTCNGTRDIGWAEAIGFELLVRTLAALPELGNLFVVHGDNTGIVEGWWRGRHRNPEVNNVFRRIHAFSHALPGRFEIHTTYVASKSNPADLPSRGIYGPLEFLLPPISLPEPILNFLVDATLPLTPTELRLLREQRYPPAAAKNINRILLQQGAVERARASSEEEEQVILAALRDR